MMGMEEKLSGDTTDVPQEAVSQETVSQESVSQEATPENDELVPGSTLTHNELDLLTDNIVRALKTVYDPEIPVDVYELGLIYRVDIDDDHKVDIDMTLTAPGCPVAGEMPIWVRDAVSLVAGVSDVNVNMVFDPPWDMSRMSDEARVALNMF